MSVAQYVSSSRLQFFASLVAAVLSFSSASQLPGQTTEFVNLTVPAPEWTDREATWVLRATERSSIIAQGGAFGWRDIRVIEVEGEEWHFVGENGDGITGIKGSLLQAVGASPDGRLWLVAEHARFPKRTAGNQFCLYVLEDDKWTAVGPRFGAQIPQAKMFTSRDGGLHFLGDNRPVTVRNDTNSAREHATWRRRLQRLEGDHWVALPGHEYVIDRTTDFRFAWRENDAWLMHIHKQSGRTDLDVRRLKGVLPEDVDGPFLVDSWPHRITLSRFAVSAEGPIAISGWQVDEAEGETRAFIKIYLPIAEGRYKAEEVPHPGEVDGVIEAIAWGDGRAIFVVTDSTERLVVDRYADRQWTRVAKVKQPREFETILTNSKLFFRDDGQPIVTWERFTTVD